MASQYFRQALENVPPETMDKVRNYIALIKNMPMNIYWVSDSGNFENWFVYAKTPEKAKEVYNEMMGGDWDDDEITATFVKESQLYSRKKADFISIEDLDAEGFLILRDDSPMVVQLNDTVYREGDILRSTIMFEELKKQGKI